MAFPHELNSRCRRSGSYNPLTLWRRAGILARAANGFFILSWAILAGVVVHYRGEQALFFLALCNFGFSQAYYRRYRLIEDTPTTRLGTGAQGYVELQGQVCAVDATRYQGCPELPVNVWSAGLNEEQPFYLDDGKGRCLLYPGAAEMVVRPADTHLYWLPAIYPGQTLYVLGEMRTVSSTADHASSLRKQTGQILARWKARPDVLLEAYDTDGNGVLDQQEWQAVRIRAGAVARQALQQETRLPPTHVIDRSRDGRLFMITNIPPTELALRFRVAAWLHGLAWIGLMLASLR
ncbi:MAG: hypothetical protein KDI44_05045 [Thiothrix sp.]|nr:hypothetical protein [Thiothrix sp.]HPQ95144.1 hypothetical protein [Thiolinea sp.]